MANQGGNYEFEERAAIREFDGGFPRDVAEFLARDEIQIRKVQANITERRKRDNASNVQEAKKQNPPEPVSNAQQERPHTAKRRKINELRQQREIVFKKMQRETNEERKSELR